MVPTKFKINPHFDQNKIEQSIVSPLLFARARGAREWSSPRLVRRGPHIKPSHFEQSSFSPSSSSSVNGSVDVSPLSKSLALKIRGLSLFGQGEARECSRRQSKQLLPAWSISFPNDGFKDWGPAEGLRNCLGKAGFNLVFPYPWPFGVFFALLKLARFGGF
jgi:hypothetical protein